VDTGDLGHVVPIHVDVRFALPSVPLGSPSLPFTEACPLIVSEGGITLKFTVRRGVDKIAPVTVDEYQMSIGSDGVVDRIPFDIVTCKSLAVDVMMSPGHNASYGVWIEAVATIVDVPSHRALIAGYTSAVGYGPNNLPSVIPASALSIALLPFRAGRTQFIIMNTSTNATLWLAFASTSDPSRATLAIVPGGRYESPVGGYCGVVSGIWDNAAPNGAAFVTEGINE
jgi:hypothetical protein